VKMKYANEYLEHLEGILAKIKANEEQYRETAAAILERVKQGGMIFPFGTGHGHLWHSRCSIALAAWCGLIRS